MGNANGVFQAGAARVFSTALLPPPRKFVGREIAQRTMRAAGVILVKQNAPKLLPYRIDSDHDLLLFGVRNL